MLLASWCVGEQEGCTKQRPQPGWVCHHHTSLHPATSPPAGCILTLSCRQPAGNSERSELRAKRLHYRMWPLEGSRRATAVAQHERFSGWERSGQRRGSRQRPAWQRSGHSGQGGCTSLPESATICSEAFALDKEQTRHLITVTYIYSMPGTVLTN